MLRLPFQDNIRIKKLTARVEELEQSNRFRGASRVYRKLCRLDPENPRWPRKEGDALRRLDRTAQAVRVYERAITLHLGLDEHRHAVALCHLILNMDPENMEVRRMVRRLEATSTSWSKEQDRRLANRMTVEQGIPQTEPGWPAVGEITTLARGHEVDVARAQAQAIRDAADSGQGIATWSPPATTPMVDISSEISGEIMTFEPLEPTLSVDALPPVPNKVSDQPSSAEMAILPVADNPYGAPEDSLDDIPITIVDLPPPVESG